MNFFFSFLLLLSVIVPTIIKNFNSKMSSNQFVYPNSNQHPELTIQQNFHGKIIEDKFKWLEDSKSPDVKKWVEEQNKITDNYIGRFEKRIEVHERYKKDFFE